MIDDDVVRDDDRDDHARREVSLRTERHNKNRLEGLGRGAAAAATRARALAPGGRRAVAVALGECAHVKTVSSTLLLRVRENFCFDRPFRV